MTVKLTRGSRLRKRALLTGTLFDFIRIEVFCPKCGQNDHQSLAELAANDMTTCGHCRNIIDVSTKSWRSRIAEQAEIHKKIKPM